jgi:ABC-type amino acid transport substrate-binding protein
VVGIHAAPPFAIKSGDDWDGIAVHLWRELARDLDLDYQWQETAEAQLLDQVQTGEIDLALTAIATANHEQAVDLTHSYYTTSLGVAERRQQNLIEIVKAVLSPRFLRIALWLSVIFIIIGILVWAFERQNNEQFPKKPVQGIWSGFWWAGVTMTTIGYGDKAPKTVGGRILALLWMLIAMGITASLTASITTVLTVNPSSLQSFQLSQDLGQMKIGSVADSASSEYLNQEQIQFQSFSDPLAGLKAVQQHDLDLFVYSQAPLQYLNQQSLQNGLSIQSLDVQAKRYAIALPPNDNLYDTMNQQVLAITAEPDWRALLDRYISESS